MRRMTVRAVCRRVEFQEGVRDRRVVSHVKSFKDLYACQ